MGNNALNVNPQYANIDQTVNGSNWLWAAFSVLVLSTLVMLVWAHTRPRGMKAFHHLAVIILTTASIAYFSMASRLGQTGIAVEYIRGGSLGGDWVSRGVLNPTRAVYYARYIDWTITTPLLLLELLLATGMNLSRILTVIFFDLVMIETGLMGALTASRYKWGFFTFGCAALVYVWWNLLVPGRKSANLLGHEYASEYKKSAIFLSVIWLLYPIIWGLCEGGNVISPTSEMVAYGVLDLIAKPVFCFYHCWSISKLDYTRFGFMSSKYSTSAYPEEFVAFRGERPEGNGPVHMNTGLATHTRNSTSTAVEPNNGRNSGFFGKKNKNHGVVDATPLQETHHTIETHYPTGNPVSSTV